MIVGAVGESGGLGSDAFVVGFTHDGQPLLTSGYGFALGRGSGGSAVQDLLWAVSAGPDGTLLLAGAATDVESEPPSIDAWLVVVEPDGSVALQKAYGAAGLDIGAAAAVATAGGFLVGGATNSFGLPDLDAWVFRVDLDGALAFTGSSGGHVRDTTAVVGAVPSVTVNTCVLAQATTQSSQAAALSTTVFEPLFDRQAPPAQHTLDVSKDGTGTGHVGSNGGSIDCGATCSASFDTSISESEISTQSSPRPSA